MPEELLMIEAVIQPYRLDAVTRALEDVDGFGGMTVTECRGFGQERLRALGNSRRGDVPNAPAARPVHDLDITEFTAKVKVECVVAGRTTADAVAEAIAGAAHTGLAGDGKIFIWPIAREIRIRTLEGTHGVR